MMVSRDATRVANEPAYVLHATSYKETSLILHVFSRHYGRVAAVAKGAKRPHSALRGVLISLQPLLLGWSGKGEVKTLTQADWVGGQPALRGDSLLQGFYLNELLLKLLAREDAHVSLFDHYRNALIALATGAARAENALRQFEFSLLRELGVGADWRKTSQGDAVLPGQRYVCLPEMGIRLAGPSEAADLPVIEGEILLSMAHGDFSQQRTLQLGKQLIRYWLHHLLSGRTLSTRQMLIELHQIAP
jgi:DNA repair protein RecO (recombination protein O)